jgi:hypothetical protein
VKRLLDEFGAQIVEVRPLPSGEEPAVPVEGEGEAEETA